MQKPITDPSPPISEPLEALSRISYNINTLQEINPLLEKIMDIAIQTLDAERGFILLKKSASDFDIKTARNITNDVAMDLTQVSKSVVHQALDYGEPIISYNVQTDERFKGAQSIMVQHIQSVACVPLKIKQRSIGVIYLDSVLRKSKFTDNSLLFLKIFAHQAAIAIENAELYEALQLENLQLRQQIQQANLFDEIIGSSASMQKVFDLMNNILNSDVTALIQGESGTGKELIARALHYNGIRKNKSFLALFCGVLPESLLESELLGHKKGAFTGATADKKGLFEAAHTGSFFLDEVGELTPKIQIQLLRVLQEGEIKRVGETHLRRVDVRIIAATNKNLFQEVKKGNFREDLYYRLNVITINLPPLRERGKDVELLAHYFLHKFTKRTKKAVKGFSADTLKRINLYNWPGNVRELENTVERAVILARESFIKPDDLQLPGREIELTSAKKLRDVEQQLVLKILAETNNNITEAAQILGVSRRWLHYRLKEWKHEDNR